MINFLRFSKILVHSFSFIEKIHYLCASLRDKKYASRLTSMSLRVMATSMQAREEANCIAMFGNEGILMSGSRPPEFKYRKY